MGVIAPQKEDCEDAHLLTASFDGSVRIIPLNLHEGDDEFIVSSIQMFSVRRGGIAQFDVIMTNSGGILLLSVDGGGTLQLFQTVHGEAIKQNPTLLTTTKTEKEFRSIEWAKERFARTHFSAVASIEEQQSQSWAAWKIGLEAKEQRRDFESEIVAMEESQTSLKEEIANLMSSNSALPGERNIITVGKAIRSTCGSSGEGGNRTILELADHKIMVLG